MAIPNSREALKQYALRKLGAPVIEINVAEVQIQDRIDDAIQKWQEFHQDGTAKTYFKHQVTQDDIEKRSIPLPDNILQVYQVFPIANVFNISGIFGYKYQYILNELPNLLGGDISNFYLNQQHLELISQIFSGSTIFRFNRYFGDTSAYRTDALGNFLYEAIINGQPVTDPVAIMAAFAPQTVNLNDYRIQEKPQPRLFLDIDWGGAVNSIEIESEMGGSDIILESDEDTAATSFSGDNSYTQELVLEESVTSRGSRGEVDVGDIVVVETIITLDSAKLYGDIFLKEYTAALIQKQWGMNLIKMTGVQLPGGISLNGEAILAEAKEELQKLEEDLKMVWSEPITFFTAPGLA